MSKLEELEKFREENGPEASWDESQRIKYAQLLSHYDSEPSAGLQEAVRRLIQSIEARL